MAVSTMIAEWIAAADRDAFVASCLRRQPYAQAGSADDGPDAIGTHSCGWHYDFEDVFIAQTRGIKDYYVRDNTEEARGAARLPRGGTMSSATGTPNGAR